MEPTTQSDRRGERRRKKEMASAVAGEEEHEGSRLKACSKDPEDRVIRHSARPCRRVPRRAPEKDPRRPCREALRLLLRPPRRRPSSRRRPLAPKSAHYTAVASPSARLVQLLRRAVGTGSRGGFSVTCLCTKVAMGARMACKSISNRMPVDVEDACRRLRSCATWRRTQISSPSTAPTTTRAPYHAMELCKGGELFTGSPCRATTPSVSPQPSPAPSLRSSRNGVIHRDLKPEKLLICKQVGEFFSQAM